MAETSTNTPTGTKLVLGPFVGNITRESVKLWLNVEATDADKTVFVRLRLLAQGPPSNPNPDGEDSEIEIEEFSNPVVVKTEEIKCRKEDLGTGTVTINGLKANARYSYELWQDKDCSHPLDLNPPKPVDQRSKPKSFIEKKDLLKADDLFFWTLPEDGYWRQLDFLLMSCHYPARKLDDGYNGFAVWNKIPDIIKENKNLRFAILAGDQIYADDVEAKVLAEDNKEKRRQYYFDTYKDFWDDIDYRRVLCRLPAFLIWDDHDITDGWGSREDSFRSRDCGKFTKQWERLFETAKETFGIMQASRNPDPLDKQFGFDTCFRIGKAGFVIADLRSNRNIRHSFIFNDGKKKWIGRMWRPQQLQAIERWIDDERLQLETIFFVSSVVFSHGAPAVEQFILQMWFRVLDIVNLAGRFRALEKPVQWFNSTFGDLRDDINDSWGSEANQKEASRVLDFLFNLENPPESSNSTPERPLFDQKPLNVVILSGDIHTPGHSTIYSSHPKHVRKAVIPHIVATPVSYEPFSWVGEAVFRHLTKVVNLGEQKPGKKSFYTSQVSHHFCYRNVAVVSLRSYKRKESHLKVKYYLEDFPEPQVVLFDLNHGAHREGITWSPPVAKPKSRWAKLLFWSKPKPVPISVAPIPLTPFELPDIRPE